MDRCVHEGCRHHKEWLKMDMCQYCARVVSAPCQSKLAAMSCLNFNKSGLKFGIEETGSAVSVSSFQPEPRWFPSLKNPTMRKVYLMGSLRNPLVKEIGQKLREELGFEVFDDWQAAAPDADDAWKVYEEGRGRNYIEALKGYAAQQVFNFDLKHLDDSTAGLLVLPAGRSAHMELGYLRGQDKKVIILLDGDYDRWDVMYNFATMVTFDIDKVIQELLA